MAFNPSDVAGLLVRCHRRCCICHKFCGVKIETAHIETGNNNIENAIPVCFECHTEIGHYNPQHPKGRKFTPDELRGHKKQWLKICEEHPQILTYNPVGGEVGPLEAMIFELKFNLQAVNNFSYDNIFIVKSDQFNLAISRGSLSILPDNILQKINDAYLAVGQIQIHINRFVGLGSFDAQVAEAKNQIMAAVNNNKQKIEDALTALTSFLYPDE